MEANGAVRLLFCHDCHHLPALVESSLPGVVLRLVLYRSSIETVVGDVAVSKTVDVKIQWQRARYTIPAALAVKRRIVRRLFAHETRPTPLCDCSSEDVAQPLTVHHPDVQRKGGVWNNWIRNPPCTTGGPGGLKGRPLDLASDGSLVTIPTRQPVKRSSSVLPSAP